MLTLAPEQCRILTERLAAGVHIATRGTGCRLPRVCRLNDNVSANHARRRKEDLSLKMNAARLPRPVYP
jgi:hypothetical protein